VWSFFTVRAERRWRGYVNTLRAQDGIVVTEARKSWSAYAVAGLRDPLAVDPAQLLGAAKIDPRRVTFRWEPYESLSAEMILRRATLRLQPPSGVTLRLVNRVLVATGSAPHAWADTARRRAESLPGITSFDTSQLQDDTFAALAAGVSAIEQTTVLFEEGTRLADGQGALLDKLGAQIAELRRAAVIAGKRLRLTITGHTDTTGSEELNLRLSRQRAEQIVAQLGARGVPPDALTAVGAGSRAAARDPAAGQNQPANRRATLQVTLDDAPTP
jgi:OOP family OmpA-OmpF porin